MNGISHYLVGVIITVWIVNFFDKNEKDEFQFNLKTIVIIVVLTVISHIFVDAFAHFTYHPSESDWSDPIYTGWHLLTYVAEAVSAVYLLRTDVRFSYGMIGSVAFDLWDWSLRRGLDLDFLPSVHWMADGTEKILFNWWMPSLRNEQWALFVEVVVVLILFRYWKQIYSKTKMVSNQRQVTNFELFALLLIVGGLRLLTLI